MKKKKEDIFPEIISALKEIKSLYPNTNICKHLSVVVDDYGDLWGVSDKEFLFALIKYKAQLQMDVPHERTDEEELKKIIKDGMNLSLTPDEDFINGQDY